MNVEELRKQLDGLGGDIKNFLAAQKAIEDKVSQASDGMETVSTELAELKTTNKATEEWIKEIEAKVNKRSKQGLDGRNSLLEAIPERDRRHLTIADTFRHQLGLKTREAVIEHTAMSLWMSKMILANAADLSFGEKNRLAEEKRTLEAGFGSDLVTHAAQGETTTGTGPELILTPVEAEVLRLIQDNSYIRQVARMMPMVSKTHQIPSLDTDVIAYFAAEAATITDSMSATNWSQKALTAKKLAGLATISNELLQDNIVGLPSFLFGAIAEQIGRLEDTEAIEGTGTNWTGVNAATGVNTIAATTNGDAITYKSKLIEAIFTAEEVDSRQNAAWFMHPKAAIECFGLTDTNGMPIFQLPNATTVTAMPSGARGMLLGYPAFVHSGILANRTKGTGTSLTNIYFGNWKKLIIGDLLGLTFFTDPYSLSSTDSVKIRVTKRTAAVVGVPAAFTVIKDITTT